MGPAGRESESPTLKNCGKCASLLPLSDFSRNRASRDGLCAHCKRCSAERIARWIEENSDRHKEIAKRRRERTKDEKKKYDAERRKAKADLIRAQDRLRHSINKEEKNAKNRAKYLENRDFFLARNREFRERNREAINEAARANKVNTRTKRARYRAALRLAVPIWFDKELATAIYIEADQLTTLTGIPHHVDHIVPIRSQLVCGLHWHANLQAIPKLENLKKSNVTWPDMP